MWSKVTNALKNHGTNKDEQSSTVMSKVYKSKDSKVDESIFHAKENPPKLLAPLHERSQTSSFGETVFYSMANSGVEASKVDESIFHAKETPPKSLHERSQTFSFGETVFHSMANSGAEADKSPTSPDNVAIPPPTEHKPDSVVPQQTLSTLPSIKTRTRSMSDTVFQTMLRSSSSQPRLPEADINDESTAGLVVYSGGVSDPDPFSAHANTYYTPQTMIPATPPKDALRHVRKTSKEESLIISLQTQLALRTELCGHYEVDLKARDELVEMLSKKLADLEKDDAKRKNALRSWKKKVQELERVCRHLEESVEDSKQSSMERSIMDEASSEALRMLHGQIASLEREKNEWSRREQRLREEVETLESLVKARSEDIMNLKETLWTRDESQRELQQGIRDAKEQMDQMGNVSIGMVDEEEIKKLMMERDQKNIVEKARHQTIEVQLQQEVQELKTKYENLQIQRNEHEEQLEQVNQQLKSRDHEYMTLKAELEAQWDHTAKASEQIEVLEKQNADLCAERDALKADVEELETRISAMEVEWNESENRKNEVEHELQEVWNLKDAVEKERDGLEDALQQVREQAVRLAHDLQERDDRVSELEQERQFANDNITRLKREHAHLVNEQTRALRDAADQEGQSSARLDQLVRAKAEADVEIKTSRDRIIVLKEEVERLRRHVHSLQQESADKEVKMVQMTRQHSLDKEDLQGLNIALDSKQQELELLKRKNGVKGTAGSTQPSKVPHRRDSSIFIATPTMSRPPSVISDSGTDALHIPKKVRISSEMAPSVKPMALGKSARVNRSGTSSVSSSANKSVAFAGIDGSMGPPLLKSRPSVVGTPTPLAKGLSLSRSSSARPAVTTPVLRRRVSSANSEHKVKTKISRVVVNASPAPSVLEQDEKENVGDGLTASSERA